MSVTLYGIKNCDTVKKARKWLDANSVSYTFHDFRVDGINKTLINSFLKQIELETLINKRGTTWRKLSDEEKEYKNKTQAIELMLENPTIIKRPVLNANKKYFVGFNEEHYKSIKLS
jgi:Spx/MgsR family transcriptional regulator